MDVLSKFKISHITRLSVKEIIGVDPTIEHLVEVFKRSPAEPTMTILSNVAVSFANDGFKAVEDYLRKELLNPVLCTALESEERRKGARIAIFNEMTLFLLMDFCRQYSPNDESIKFNFGEVGRNIAFGFIVGNYFSNFPEAGQSNKSRETYTKFAIREAIFNEHDQLRYALGRANLIFNLLYDQVSAVHRFNVSEFIQDQYGFSLSDYFQTIVALFAQWGSQSIKTWDPSRNYISLETFFRGCEDHGQLTKVIKQLTQDWKPITKESLEYMDNDTLREYMYSRVALKSKPLVTINGRIYPMSMRFLLLSCWTGPYYLVIDKLRDLKQDREPFFHFLGPSTEIYSRALLKHTFGRKFMSIETTRKTPMGDCVIEINPRWLLIFEVKSKRPNVDAITGDKPLKDNSSVDKMLVQPLAQLSDRIIEYRKQFKGKITPIVVTAGTLFLNELTWPEYFKLVSHLPLFNDPKVDTPIFLDLEALEVLCACIQNGHNISKIVREKNSRSWKHDDFKNFIYHSYLKKCGSAEPINQPVRDASTDIFDHLRKRLFPKENELTEEELSDWRKVFGITAS